MDEDTQVEQTGRRKLFGSKTEALEYTDEMMTVARTAAVPDELREFVKGRVRGSRVRIELFRQIQADARSENEALLAVRELQRTKGEWVSNEQLKEEADRQLRRANSLETTLSAVQQNYTELVAQQALVVHSGHD